ncbi:unnamed protein product [Linum tenue]|uniref:Uncharacterized protein n=1 Tax=Linum tenue TaxID=586396 RepID=A0AAV0HTW2_9ROSI|nr:unnamed protein product [Linum tenue]
MAATGSLPFAPDPTGRLQVSRYLLACSSGMNDANSEEEGAEEEGEEEEELSRRGTSRGEGRKRDMCFSLTCRRRHPW